MALPTSFYVEITAADLLKAKRHPRGQTWRAIWSPIAIASRRALGRRYVTSSLSMVEVWNKSFESPIMAYRGGQAMLKFNKDFLAGKPVCPASFFLRKVGRTIQYRKRQRTWRR